MPWRKGNRLRLVTEQEADDDTRRIYAEVRDALGIPALRLFYPALGVYPIFLRLHWDAMKAVAGSQELFSCAERLRADSYTRAFNYFRIHDLTTHGGGPVDGQRDELASIADFYHFKEPLVLLLFCLQLQAMEGPAGQEGPSPTPHEPLTMLAEAPSEVSEQSAPPATKKRLEEIRRTLAVPFVNPEFCAFARWPEFLDQYWETLKHMIASPLYDECRYGVRSTAWTLAAQLPGPVEITPEQLTDAGMSVEEVASVARILELFVSNLSGQLLNIAAAKIALEGGNAVRSRHIGAPPVTDNPDITAA